MAQGEPIDILLSEIAVHSGDSVIKKRTAQNIYLLVQPLDKFDSKQYEEIGEIARKNYDNISRDSKQWQDFAQDMKKKVEQYQQVTTTPETGDKKSSATQTDTDSFVASDRSGASTDFADTPLQRVLDIVGADVSDDMRQRLAQALGDKMVLVPEYDTGKNPPKPEIGQKSETNGNDTTPKNEYPETEKQHKQQEQAVIEQNIDKILAMQGLEQDGRQVLMDLAKKLYGGLFKDDVTDLDESHNTPDNVPTQQPPKQDNNKPIDMASNTQKQPKDNDIIIDTHANIANTHTPKTTDGKDTDNGSTHTALMPLKTPVSKRDDTIEHVLNQTADDEMVRQNLMVPWDYANSHSPNNQMLITMADKYFKDAYKNQPVRYDATGKMVPTDPYKPPKKNKTTLDNMPINYGLSGLGLGLAGSAQKMGKKKAVQTVQQNLNADRKSYEPKLKVDGDWGPKTNAQARRSVMRNTVEDSMQLAIKQREQNNQLFNHKGTKKSKRWQQFA